MDLIGHLVGQTTLYEERRGDFCSARLEAQKLLDEAKCTGDPVRLKAALVAYGIACMLQGNTLVAHSHLERATTLTQDDFGPTFASARL